MKCKNNKTDKGEIVGIGRQDKNSQFPKLSSKKVTNFNLVKFQSKCHLRSGKTENLVKVGSALILTVVMA